MYAATLGMRPLFRPVGVSKMADVRFMAKKAFTAEKPSEIKHLTLPIGQKEPPLPTDNNGIDTRTFAEKKKDFTDMQKNRERREELKKEFAESTFQPIYGFRDTGGKFFTAPKAPFEAKQALYMPNLCGTTLDGVERSTISYFGKQLTVVRLFASTIAEKQLESYLPGIEFDKWDVQLLDINAPTSWFNEKLVKWFSGRIKKSIKGDYHHYLVCRKGLTIKVREEIWATNPLGGYLYVVDKQGKIRWAASGEATDSEANLLRRILSGKL